MKLALAIVVFLYALGPKAMAETTVIRFGCCVDQHKAQPIWGKIRQGKTDLFVFLGDTMKAITNEESQLEAGHLHQFWQNKEYRQFKMKNKFIAIWNDKDYGREDAGKEYPLKIASRDFFLSQFNQPERPVRQFQYDGIYTFHRAGTWDYPISLIVLDTRYMRTPLRRRKGLGRKIAKRLNQGPYVPTFAPEARILGERQWQWLEKSLQQPARLRIIATTNQFVADFTGRESWSNFPREKKRLLDILAKHKIERVLFISGDTLWGEVSKMNRANAYPLLEITSGGLAETAPTPGPNRFRSSKTFHEINFAELAVNSTDKATTVRISIIGMGETPLYTRTIDVEKELTYKDSQLLSAKKQK